MANHWRNLLIDLDRSMQGASEWWIFHKGTECLSATSLIFKAKASTPLATHTDASIPRSYSSAMAK